MKELLGGIPSPEKNNPFSYEADGFRGFDELTFLCGIEKITKKEINDFRETRIVPNMQSTFDRSSETERMILVAIDLLPENKLDELKQMARSNNKRHMVVIHDVKTSLLSLRMLTRDEKYNIKNI